MSRTERIGSVIFPREGVRPRQVLDAIRDHVLALNGKPWILQKRRPLVLNHSQARAKGLRYELKTDGDDVIVILLGGQARLGLGYFVTLIANARFADLIEGLEIDLPPLRSQAQKPRSSQT